MGRRKQNFEGSQLSNFDQYEGPGGSFFLKRDPMKKVDNDDVASVKSNLFSSFIK